MRRSHRRAQAGFTLVELMVSLTLFSFAIAGVLAVAMSMAQGYREQRQIIQTESTARSALDFMSDAIRQASPAVANAKVTSTATPSAGQPHIVVGDIEDTEVSAPGCNPVTGNQPSGSIRFFDGGTGASDKLEIVYASGAAVTSIGSTGTAQWVAGTDTTVPLTDTSDLAVGDRILVTDGTNGHVAKITALAADSATIVYGSCTITPRTYARGDLVVRVFRAQFYIGTFDTVSPVLIMDPDGDGAAAEEPLADYVEDFQVSVGVDESDGAAGASNGQIDADEWGFAGGASPTSFTNDKLAKALRITLVARAPSPLQQAAAPFFRPAIENRTVGAADRYRRRILSATVDVRNLVGSP